MGWVIFLALCAIVIVATPLWIAHMAMTMEDTTPTMHQRSEDDEQN
jgi:hypothetical protein